MSPCVLVCVQMCVLPLKLTDYPMLLFRQAFDGKNIMWKHKNYKDFDFKIYHCEDIMVALMALYFKLLDLTSTPSILGSNIHLL